MQVRKTDHRRVGQGDEEVPPLRPIAQRRWLGPAISLADDVPHDRGGSTRRPGKVEDLNPALFALEIRPRPLRPRPPGDTTPLGGRRHDVLIDDGLGESEQAIGIVGLRPEEVDLGVV